MELSKQNLDEIKKSNNPEIINNFLIKVSKNPKTEYLSFLQDLIEYLNPQILDKVKLNLIFALGEIGSLISIDEYYQNFLYETYHHSDRWVRNEIIQSIEKISSKSDLNRNIIGLVGSALNDDYNPIQYNALRVLKNLSSFPDSVFKNLFHALNSKNPEVIEGCKELLDKIRFNPQEFFNLLNQYENYKILKPRAIRSLLLIQFKSIIQLESFRDNILSSEWDKNYIEKFLKELDTYERILIKNI
ncbi:MAG: HEAT repeat domain-containing protein [Candidatus Hermodarchaeota archaeon]